jgi:hypothetical protein
MHAAGQGIGLKAGLGSIDWRLCNPGPGNLFGLFRYVSFVTHALASRT